MGNGETRLISASSEVGSGLFGVFRDCSEYSEPSSDPLLPRCRKSAVDCTSTSRHNMPRELGAEADDDSGAAGFAMVGDRSLRYKAPR